jgi:hypothetical protein
LSFPSLFFAESNVASLMLLEFMASILVRRPIALSGATGLTVSFSRSIVFFSSSISLLINSLNSIFCSSFLFYFSSAISHRSFLEITLSFLAHFDCYHGQNDKKNQCAYSDAAHI